MGIVPDLETQSSGGVGESVNGGGEKVVAAPQAGTQTAARDIQMTLAAYAPAAARRPSSSPLPSLAMRIFSSATSNHHNRNQLHSIGLAANPSQIVSKASSDVSTRLPRPIAAAPNRSRCKPPSPVSKNPTARLFLFQKLRPCESPASSPSRR